VPLAPLIIGPYFIIKQSSSQVNLSQQSSRTLRTSNFQLTSTPAFFKNQVMSFKKLRPCLGTQKLLLFVATTRLKTTTSSGDISEVLILSISIATFIQ
jgi:hypothetical protein